VEENCIIDSLYGTLAKYYNNDKIEENEMGRACSTYEREEKCVHSSGGKTLRERDH
jgi:hypothetical protein